MSFLFIITEDKIKAIVPINIATTRDLVMLALVEEKLVEIIFPIFT